MPAQSHRLADAGLTARIAESADEIRAAQALRYRCFLADGLPEAQASGLDSDGFDPLCSHVILTEASGAVVGTSRLLPGHRLAAGQGFCSETEFDLTLLRASGLRILEIGRTCLDPAWRGTAAILVMWDKMTRFADGEGAEMVIGLASLPGVDAQHLAPALTYLHDQHLAQAALRPVVRAEGALDFPRSASPSPRDLPPILKSYIRMGARIGQGAFADHAFGLTDVLMLLDRRQG